ncbi:MAG: efflux RND transporter periplasmic adaptor subunit [Planctomycetaceae bacterium]|nr:efflux RND transporter periplasmic adaptor subunit [Planctomycetaceae bacterium]
MSTVTDRPQIQPSSDSNLPMEANPALEGRLENGTISKRTAPRRWRVLLASMAALLTVTILTTIGWYFQSNSVDSALVLHTVQQTDLEITVTERGNLESQTDERVLCEVDDVEGDGINGTPIVWIVENGSSVKKGELIVELNSSMLRNRLDEQVLDVEEAKSVYVQADVGYENQITQNATILAEAQLKVELDKLALKQFEDEEGGTFQIELQNVELIIQEAEAGELIQQTNLTGVEQLYKLGYRSSGELAQARLETLKAERELAAAISKKKELVEYQYKKQKLELQGALASANRALEQVERDNIAQLTQAEAKKIAAQESLKKEEERLTRYQNQIEKCEIRAPIDGMVAYATGRSRYHREEIRPGAAVRPRQPILTLPNLQSMQVRTTVHESVLDQITQGLKVSIRVDAFPDRAYQGTVQSVAVLPDQGGWMSSDTKVYATVITIDEKVEQLKPGMTAVVDIHVDHLRDILAIPIQSILQVKDETWCYVNSQGGNERRFIELGRTNDKFVEIKSGLRAGENVVLNPNAVTNLQNSDDVNQENQTDRTELASS